MNNNERLVDDNTTVSIPDNEKKSPVEHPKAEKQKKSSITIRELTIIGLLAGITIALGLSGYGIIPLGPLNVTTLHVPTLIGAIVEGPKVGGFVGFIFGCYSLWQNITAPNILSPLFINPIISVLPRVLFPILAYLVYLVLWKAPQGPRIIVTAFMGTIFHTIMVMGLIFLLYADMFALKMNLSPDQVLGSILFLSATHGIPEAVFAAVIVTPVAMALRKVLRKDKPKKTNGEDVTVTEANVREPELAGTTTVETKETSVGEENLTK